MDDSINKNSLYKKEIPYRIVKNMAEIYWPHQNISELHNYGLMLIKPETILIGKTLTIFSILQSSGYELVYFLHKKICPTCISEMWKFSWINASLERILVNQKLFSTYESLILILHVRTPNTKSACELLTDLKGSAKSCERKPYQIREKIKPINYILNYVHTSDDQHDFLREIGILLDWEELIQAFEAMTSNRIIPYPNIDEPYLSKLDLTLDSWLKNIYINMESSLISSSDRKYIINNIQILKSNNKQKITLDFLYVLCRNKLIHWDFETIAVISNHINYMK
mgnify:CR=1 FL=1